jgi:hypothetical protein
VVDSLYSGFADSVSLSKHVPHPTFGVFSACTASEHLQDERNKLEAKLQLLLEERDLIDRHLVEQRAKQVDLAKVETALKERAALVGGTLSNLQVTTSSCALHGMTVMSNPSF